MRKWITWLCLDKKNVMRDLYDLAEDGVNSAMCESSLHQEMIDRLDQLKIVLEEAGVL